MKKITLLFILCLGFVTWSYGQCTNPVYQFPTTTVNITAAPGPQTIATNNWAQNEYSVLDGLVIGESYTVTTSIMTYITVTTDGTAVVVHGFDSVSFVATTTSITIYWTLDAACNNGPNTNILTQIECTSCTCVPTAAPSCVTEIGPTDGNLNVVLGAGNSVTFEWNTDPLAETYELFINGFSQGNRESGITFTGFANSTAYTWSVVPANCFGVATACATWGFTTEACTATAAPGVATTSTPANMAVDVPIDTSAAPTLTIDPFSWVDAATGDPATSYDWTFGITPTGDDIGGIAGFASGGGINYTWEYSTTYYWKVDAVNCFGTTTGTVWSFTTEADPSLSTTEFNTELFSVYPNPAKDVISIKTDASITNAEVYNQLGQRVIQVNADAIVDKKININNLNNGIYFLKINAEGKQQTIKFIKE